MSGTFDDRGGIDPRRGVIVWCVGKKGSGKSIMGLVWFQAYRGDRVVIDIAADDGPMGDDVIELVGDVSTLPRKWPEHLRREDRSMTLRYVPDAGSPTFAEDIDAVIGLAMAHGDCAVIVHEIGRAAPVGRTKPHMSALLQHNRHRRVTAIFCGPRVKTTDTLIREQADLIYIFELNQPADRAELAAVMGWEPNSLDEALDELQRHEYLRFDANEAKPDPGAEDQRLLSFPPLPADLVAQVERFKRGAPARA